MEKKEKTFEYNTPELCEVNFAIVFGASSCDDYAAGSGSAAEEIEIPCDNLSDRKQLMMDQSDVFIALPGGIGTIDEVFTVASSATIG
ncbi:MAG: LOG family protein, partial [Oscillospiraceae bacterium]|nr:LOG family protein [Oscillospiraceae bacterium]